MTVHEDGEVEFATGKFALDDVNGVADSSTFSGLLGDKLVSDHLIGEYLGLFRSVCKSIGCRKCCMWATHE